MSEPSVLPRVLIIEQADHAALLAARTGVEQQCPYPVGSDEAMVWRAAYQRYLLLHSAPDDTEAGA